MKTKIMIGLMIGLLCPMKGYSYMSEQQIRADIQQEMEYERQRQENQKRFDEALEKQQEKKEREQNWSPYNDTDKAENKDRYWDSSTGSFQQKEKDEK